MRWHVIALRRCAQDHHQRAADYNAAALALFTALLLFRCTTIVHYTVICSWPANIAFSAHQSCNMAPTQKMLSSLALASALFTLGHGEHHMKWKVERRQDATANIPLIVSNQCSETIHPAILTQAGTEPSESG